MNQWIWMLVLTGAAALASCFGAGALALLGDKRLKNLVPALVSFSTGVMLGTACLDLIPEAFAGASKQTASHLGLTMAGGILLFFALERLIHYHHSHDTCQHEQELEAGNRSMTVTIICGTGLHNFIAGVLLGAAVLVNIKTALILFAAILAHHIPQQIGDFSVLLMAGYKRSKALALTLLSSLALLVGGVICFAILQYFSVALPFIMAVAAASLIYIALADLTPRLHTHAKGKFAQTVILVAAGIGFILAVVHLLPG